MSSERRPCPACGRPNAAHAARCLYCGAALPNPTTAPVARERVVPDNLDQLVRDALSGKRAGSAQLKAALQAVGPAQVSPPPSAPARPPAAAPVRVAPAPVAAGTPPAPDPGDTFAGLAEAAARARDAFSQGNAAGSRDALDRVSSLLADACAHVHEARPSVVSAAVEVEDGDLPGDADAQPDAASLPTDVPLPPVRLPWALVLATPGSGSESLLAEALSVDPATARNLALSIHARIALRSGDRDALEVRAARARDAGLRAVVVAREDLAMLPARAALSWADGAFRTTAEPLWLVPPEPGRELAGELVDLGPARLVCPGEVEVRIHREARERSRWLRGGFHAEERGGSRRVLVIDVHTPTAIVRLVEGVTSLAGLPGYDAGSAIKSMRALVEAAATAFPGARVEGRRACAVGPVAPSAHSLVKDTGWPGWEEHTRAARALWG